MNQVTSGRAWRKPREEGVPLTLPSGNVARIRPVPLVKLIERGEVPDFLTPIAVSQIIGVAEDGTGSAWGVFEDENEPETEDDVKRMLNTVSFMEFLCKEAFVEPKIVDEPEADNEIALEDVGVEDMGFVAHASLQAGGMLELFRQRQESAMAAVAGDEAHSDEAE